MSLLRLGYRVNHIGSSRISMTGCMDMNGSNHICNGQQSMFYESRRSIGIKDALRGRNTFPHLIKYPKDYWPVPPGYEHVSDKIKLQQRLSEDELNMVQIHWGLDGLGLVVFGMVIIVGSVMLALYPARLRKERLDNQIMTNWVSENAEFLEGSAVEDLIHRYARVDDDDEDQESDEVMVDTAPPGL